MVAQSSFTSQKFGDHLLMAIGQNSTFILETHATHVEINVKLV